MDKNKKLQVRFAILELKITHENIIQNKTKANPTTQISSDHS